MADLDIPSYCAGFGDGMHGTPKAEPLAESLRPWPGLFAIMFPRLVEVARTHGYALAVHGSMRRDLDLVAVPWVEEAVAPEVLVEALRARVGGSVHGGENASSAKPLGRRCWSIHLGGGPYIDLSVTPAVRA